MKNIKTVVNKPTKFHLTLDDQSAWWYYRFVIAWASSMCKLHQSNKKQPLLTETSDDSSKIISRRNLVKLLNAEIEYIEELIEEEEGQCKWGILAVQMTYDQIKSFSNDDTEHYFNAASIQQLQRLVEMDKDRSNRYVAMLANMK